MPRRKRDFCDSDEDTEDIQLVSITSTALTITSSTEGQHVNLDTRSKKAREAIEDPIDSLHLSSTTPLPPHQNQDYDTDRPPPTPPSPPRPPPPPFDFPIDVPADDDDDDDGDRNIHPFDDLIVQVQQLDENNPEADQDLILMTEDIGRLVAEEAPQLPEEAEADGIRDNMEKPGIDGSHVKLGAIVLLVLAYSIRFRLSDEAVSHMLQLMHFILPSANSMPRSLYLLRKLLAAYVKLPTINYYCSFCYTHVDKHLQTCSNPHCLADLTKAGALAYFVLQNIESQLSRLFLKENFCKEVRTHRFKHYAKKQKPDDISDVYDGLSYKTLFNDGYLSDINNLSFSMNTDGVPVFKSSKIQMWPVYLMINELPLAQRKLKENVLLYGIWIGRKKPVMWSYLKPLQEEMTVLNDGIHISDYLGDQITVKASILTCVCDLPAKSMVCNSSQFNAAYGCWYCEQPGATWLSEKGHSTVFPYETEEPKGPHRTPQTIERDANIAIGRRQEGVSVTQAVEKGVRGPSWFMFMPNFHIIHGMVIDPMHSLYAGVMLMLLNIWFNKDLKFRTNTTSYVNSIPALDILLSKIKPLLNIRRPPRSLLDIGHWKCSELRNFLHYWGYPLLKGILSAEHLSHFCLLVRAVHNLSKDVITPRDLDLAEKCLHKFVRSIGGLYGGRYLTMNVHSLVHLVDNVRYNGPLFTNNCFVFEDMNGFLMDNINGTVGVDTQLVNTICLLQATPLLKEAFTKDEEVKVMYDKLSCNKLHDGDLVTGTDDVYMASRLDTVNLTRAQQAAILVSYQIVVHNVTRFKRVYMRSINSILCSAAYTRLEKRDQCHVKFLSPDNTYHYGKVIQFVFIDNGADGEEAVVIISPIGDISDAACKLHDISDFVSTNLLVAIPFKSIVCLIQVVKTPNATFVIEVLNTHDVD